MKDYEMMTIPNVGSPNAGMLCLIVSERRVGLYMSVLDALDKPERIMIHRGVNSNEGKLIIEGTKEKYGSIPLNYDRKRISFYNKEFVGLCKELVQKYGKGSFNKGVFFTVKGKLVEDSLVEFDFHDVMYRKVKSCRKKQTAFERYPPRKRKTNNFSMPNMATGGLG